MTWVKQNYDRFLLALLALALAVCAGMLFINARNFSNVFKSLSEQAHHNDNLPADAVKGADRGVVQKEQEKLAKPDLWTPRMIGRQRLPVFVSPPYIAKTATAADGTVVTTLENPSEESSLPLHPPVPNIWLLDNGQNLLDSNVLEQDTDADGFSTLDEYLGKTDPQKKESHPPYYTKLFLKRFVRIPFVLRFSARNGASFQLNSVDEREDTPTQFVKLNDTVQFKDVRFKVTKFEEKHKVIEGINKDVSELTLVNIKNGQTVVLPKEMDVDSPTTYAVFTYLWTGKEFAVLKDAEFTLKPEDTVKYKVVEMNDTEIKVLKEDENKTLSIKMLPKTP